jgi:tRNA pseudouridine55 synthase
LQFLQPDKAYKATIQLGITTTTDDLEGEIITSQPVSELSLAAVKAALKSFEGTIEQIPPSYSAIQVQGKRLYDLARSGKKIEVPARTVEVFKIEVLDWQPGDFPKLDVAIACGAGTYIRAIARDLGAALKIGGTLAALTRTTSSGFHLADSLTLEQLEHQLQQGKFNPIPPAATLEHLQIITLPATIAQRWCQGQRIPWNDTLGDSINTPLQIYQEGGSFLGIGHLVNSNKEQILIPQMVLSQCSKYLS